MPSADHFSPGMTLVKVAQFTYIAELLLATGTQVACWLTVIARQCLVKRRPSQVGRARCFVCVCRAMIILFRLLDFCIVDISIRKDDDDGGVG